MEDGTQEDFRIMPGSGTCDLQTTREIQKFGAHDKERACLVSSNPGSGPKEKPVKETEKDWLMWC